jgi:hypothetical protein
MVIYYQLATSLGGSGEIVPQIIVWPAKLKARDKRIIPELRIVRFAVAGAKQIVVLSLNSRGRQKRKSPAAGSWNSKRYAG